jgi:hypothetical protein
MGYISAISIENVSHCRYISQKIQLKCISKAAGSDAISKIRDTYS